MKSLKIKPKKTKERRSDDQPQSKTPSKKEKYRHMSHWLEDLDDDDDLYPINMSEEE